MSLQSGLFTYTTGNLGDEMQSYAILSNLNRVDTFLNRDNLAEWRSPDPTVAIFNSRFFQGNDLRPPSDSISPIIFGFSRGREEVLQGDWLSYLRAHGPIGCRDQYTVARLRERDVDAYWSGCLTLFFGEGRARPAQRSGVLFVDVPPEALDYIPADLVARARHTTTFAFPSLIGKPLDRWATIGKIAEMLASAELVVTRRLHVALPAASLGTPVVVIADERISEARFRFSGFDQVLPIYYLDALAKQAGDIDWLRPQEPQIPAELRESRNALRAKLQQLNLLDSGVSDSPLERVDTYQRIRNPLGELRPAAIRLRLGEEVFDVGTTFWSRDAIDLQLRGFRGLSKFSFSVEMQRVKSSEWIACGTLQELVLAPE